MIPSTSTSDTKGSDDGDINAQLMRSHVYGPKSNDGRMQTLQDLAVISSSAALVHFFAGSFGFILILSCTLLYVYGYHTYMNARNSFISQFSSPKVTNSTKSSRDRSWRNTTIEKIKSDNSRNIHSDSNTRITNSCSDYESVSDLILDSGQSISDVHKLNPGPSHEYCRRNLSVRDISNQMNAGSDQSKDDDELIADIKIAINSNKPIPFENDLFKGSVYLFIRIESDYANNWSHLFKNRRRMCWIQLQGQFKQLPKYPIYLGGELPSYISFSLISKSLAYIILNIVKKLIGKISYSFGDRDNFQLPHVTFPLYQCVDQFMCTPKGQIPPLLGIDIIGESETERRDRQQTLLGEENFDLDSTYTFHFHTMYVDLEKWSTVNIPGVHDIKLTTFFKSLPLRIVAYESGGNAAKDAHIHAKKRYLFCFEMRHGEFDSDSDAMSEMDTSASKSTTCTSAELDINSVKSENLLEICKDPICFVNYNAIRLQYLYWMEESDYSFPVRRVYYTFSLLEMREDGDIVKRLSIVSVDTLRKFLFGPLAVSQYLSVPPSPILRLHSRSHNATYATIQEEAREIGQYLQQVSEIMYSHDNPSKELEAVMSNFYQCFTKRSDVFTAKLSPESIGVRMAERDRATMDVRFERVVYRICGDSFLREEALLVTSKRLLFFRAYSNTADYIVRCTRIIDAKYASFPFSRVAVDIASDFTMLSPVDTDSIHCVQIETIAEEILVCFSLREECEEFMELILQHCDFKRNYNDANSEIAVNAFAVNPFIKIGARHVLNVRSYYPIGKILQSPVDILMHAKETLHAILDVHQCFFQAQQLSQKSKSSKILQFLKLASAFRNIDLQFFHQNASHEQKLAFNLNLYHILLAHAMLAVSFPQQKQKYLQFMTQLTYTVGKQRLTMSLAEIEHVILRARMKRAHIPHCPVDLVAQNTFTQKKLSTFGLAHPDVRISFALAMNRFDEDAVCVFEAEIIHDQLNNVASRYINGHVSVDIEKKKITLPKVCEWYSADYASQSIMDTASRGKKTIHHERKETGMYCARKLMGYLDAKTQEAMQLVLESPNCCMKYDVFNYRQKLFLEKIV